MTFEDRLVAEISTRLNEEIIRELEGLPSAQDWADHKRRTGTLNGLRKALGLVKEAAKHANQ